MQQNKQEKQQQQTKKQSPPPQPQPQPMQPPQNQSRPLTTEAETKIDLKTPSFIPVEKTRQNETDVDIPVSSPPNHAEVVVVDHDEVVVVGAAGAAAIEPDSLDPDINNENNQNHSEAEPKSESSASCAASTSAATSISGAGAAAGNVKNGGVKKPRSRHRKKHHTHSEKRYHSEVRQEAVQQALAQINKSKPVPMPSKRSSVMPTNNADSDDSTASGSDDDDDVGNGSHGGVAIGVGLTSEVTGSEVGAHVTSVTLGLSDTSSNNSLARSSVPTTSSGAHVVVTNIPIDTPPLPSRNVGQPPPSRPPVITSPSRQNSRYTT